MTADPQPRKGRLSFLLRLGATLLLVGVLAGRADWSAVAARLAEARPGPLALAVLLMAAALAAMGLRWSAALRLYTRALPVADAVRLTLVGLFLGLALPGGIGGDAVRGWCAYRAGIRPRLVVASLLLDRLLTLLAVFLLILLSLPPLAAVLPAAMLGQLAVLVLALCGGIAAVLLLDRLPLPAVLRGRLGAPLLDTLAELRRGLLSRRCLAPLGWAVLIHLMVMLVTVLLGLGLALPVSPWTCLTVMPIVILGISLPISISGWGVREGVMVAMLGLYGVAAEDALLLALALGVTNIAAALPGGALWLAGRLSPGADTPPAGRQAWTEEPPAVRGR